jgi:outer membrane protein TolC
MKLSAYFFTTSLVAAAVIFASISAEEGQVLTLGAALKLAGADHADVQLAQEQSLEARARYYQAKQQYFPWITPGLAYRRVDGRVQDTIGNMVTVDKQSYGLGLTLAAEIALGNAIYDSLVTRRRLQAADEQTEVARQQALHQTRQSYFHLVEAQASEEVARQALTLAESYAHQVHDAVTAGVAFSGDASRAQAQAQRRQLQVTQAHVAVQVAAARLAEILRLREGTTLRANTAELQPMIFVDTKIQLADQLAKALLQRPELHVQASLRQAADAAIEQANAGQLIPRIILRGSTGGLGGGPSDQDWGNFGASSEIGVGVEWRIGPGGLFDGARHDLVASQARQIELQDQYLRERITREVQVSYVEAISTVEQVRLAQTVLNTSEETLRLTRERRQFGVGAVMEAVTAEEDLTAARLELIHAVTRHNQAQAALLRAVGKAP